MNISAPFIARPIATALLMVGLLLGGLAAYPLLERLAKEIFSLPLCPELRDEEADCVARTLAP